MKERNYFKIVQWYNWAWVTVGIGTMAVGVFCPDVIPYSVLGPLGTFLSYMNYKQPTLLRLMLGATIAVHLAEGLYAYILTRRMNLTRRDTFFWTVQTTLVGFTSLLPLRAKCNQILNKKAAK